MIDTSTKQRLQVATDGTAGPYIMVPVAQLDSLLDLSVAHRVAHWVEDDAISLNGAPAVAVVNLSSGASAVQVQAVLDSAR